MALANASGVQSSCGDQDVPIATCTIHDHVCGKVHGVEWQYTGTATEPVSGKSADSGGHYDSSSGAGEHCTFNVLQLLTGSTTVPVTDPATFDCNCQAQDIVGGDACHLTVVGCFYFTDIDAMKAAVPTFSAWAWNMNDLTQTATTNGYANATEAGTEAVTELFQAYPATYANCGSLGTNKGVSALDFKI